MVYLATLATLWRPPHIKAEPFPSSPRVWIFQKMKFWSTDATVMSPSCPPIALQWRHCCVFASVQREPSKCRLVWSSCWCACMQICAEYQASADEYDQTMNMIIMLVCMCAFMQRTKHCKCRWIWWLWLSCWCVSVFLCKCASVQVCKCASVLVC